MVPSLFSRMYNCILIIKINIALPLAFFFFFFYFTTFLPLRHVHVQFMKFITAHLSLPSSLLTILLLSVQIMFLLLLLMYCCLIQRNGQGALAKINGKGNLI